MEIKKKYNLIRVLMILSMALLSGFAGYWLNNQYKQEQSVLTDLLEREYSRAMDQVMDSILFSVYIKPVISDSIELSINIDSKIDNVISVFGKTDKPSVKITERIVNKDSNDTINLNSKKIHFIQKSEFDDTIMSDKEIAWNQNDMLLRSFKMIMSHDAGKLGSDSLVLMSIEDPEITGLLSETFSEILNDKGYKFGTNWPGDSLNLNETKNNRLLISNTNSPFSIAVSLSGTQQYILKGIIPQILFVLFLIGLTASAFFMTFRTMKKQIQLNIIRKDFISNMTHELKTPVTTMKVALEALNVYGESKDPEKIKEYLTIGSDEISKLDQLISRMLDQLTLEEKGLAIQLEKINLNEIIDDCIQSLQVRMKAANATINFRHEAIPLYIMGEEWYVRTAIFNIVDNSLKYSGEKPSVTIIGSQSKDEIILEINDKGKGIPQEYKDKIFQKFFRIPTGDKHDVKGHGLGLSLVEQVMKMHGGSVKQRNLKPEGCSFTLTFKQAKSED